MPRPIVRYAPLLTSGLVPDAVLTVPVGEKALCALVECDRSTEPARQWRDKAQKYARLLGLPDLTALVGRPRARLAVVCPDLARCAWVDGLLREAGVAAWFTPRSAIGQDDFGQWRVSGGGVQPFLPPSNHPSNHAGTGGTAPTGAVGRFFPSGFLFLFPHRLAPRSTSRPRFGTRVSLP